MLVISHLSTVLYAYKHKLAYLIFAITDIINDMTFTGEETKAQKT